MSSDSEPVQCSSKGCRSDATWSLIWANPSIHSGGRTKTWMACDAHREHLEQFLGSRSFLHRVEPFAQA